MSLALTLAPNPFALAEIIFRLLGRLKGRALSHVAMVAPPIPRALAGSVADAPAPDPRPVACLPQDAHATWALAVEQVAAPGRIPGGDQAALPIETALRRSGIEALRNARIDRISGGEARRAMLARVFATEPEMFLLNEPTADLDPATSRAIPRLSRDTAEAGAVVVLHAIDVATEYAHRVALVDQGRIVVDRLAALVLEEAAALFGIRADLGPRLLPLA